MNMYMYMYMYMGVVPAAVFRFALLWNKWHKLCTRNVSV